MPTAADTVDWLVTKPIWFFYGAFVVRVAISLIRGRRFDFMRVASQAISASAVPVGLALAIVATDKTLLPKITEISGFELYIGLVALMVCYMALRAMFGEE